MRPAMGQLYALIPDMESKEKAADVAMETVRLFLQDLLGARPWNSRAFADEDRTANYSIANRIRDRLRSCSPSKTLDQSRPVINCGAF